MFYNYCILLKYGLTLPVKYANLDIFKTKFNILLLLLVLLDEQFSYLPCLQNLVGLNGWVTGLIPFTLL